MTIVVVSPHLDDAIFSLGATIRRLTSLGERVEILTVFAGDPERHSAPSYWDVERGYSTASEATLHRREEDQRAADLVGAETRWLSFDDSGYIARRDPDVIWSVMVDVVESAQAVLVPGYPLTQYDHRWLTSFMFQRLRSQVPILYVEQPYASDPLVLAKTLVRGRTTNVLEHVLDRRRPVWHPCSVRSADWKAKAGAVAAYEGEIRALGLQALWAKVSGRFLGREFIGLCGDSRGTPDVLAAVLDG